ncbi:MAG: hypothetical protein ACYCXA_11855 [Actinomycetes bacterium]
MRGSIRARRVLDRMASDERGLALLLTIASMLVLTLMATAAIGYAVQTQTTSRRAQDWSASLQAAQAGIQDYISYLNQNYSYWNVGSSSSPACSNVALQAPPSSTSSTFAAACGWTSSTPVGWKVIPGGQYGASYHYDVNTSTALSKAALTITSTGRVNGITRTVQAVLRPQGFTQYVLWYNFNEPDPIAASAIYGNSGYPGTPQSRPASWFQNKCALFAWAGRPSSCTNGQQWSFGTGYTFSGPVHVNDTIGIYGSPVFNAAVTTSDTACQGQPAGSPNCYVNAGGANPVWSDGNTGIDPAGMSYTPVIPLPTTVAALSATPDCTYTGTTRIVFNSDATMTVWSPYTTSVTSSACGSLTSLHSSAGATVAVPTNGLVSVNDVQSPSGAMTGVCAAGAVGGYPVAHDLWPASIGNPPCYYGDVYVQGVVKGRVTVTSSDRIYVTRSITYAGGPSGSDSLGLVGLNGVAAYNPYGCLNPNKNGACSGSSYANLTLPDGYPQGAMEIDAAILSINQGFDVTNLNLGNILDNIHNAATASSTGLTFFGSLAGRYADVESAGGGYNNVTYNYDARLKVASPPYFPDPPGATWAVATFAEIPAAY